MSHGGATMIHGQGTTDHADAEGRHLIKWARAKILFPAMLCAFMAACISGCGYDQAGNFDQPSQNGYKWHSLYREDIQTVAVPIFTTRDYRRGMEFTLTKSVINQLEAHAPYKVVPKERADTILEGEIVESDIQTLSSTFNNNIPQEQLLTVTVNFTWKDLRTGEILLQRKQFQQASTYYAPLGEDEFVGRQETLDRLALAIVQEMQADW